MMGRRTGTSRRTVTSRASRSTSGTTRRTTTPTTAGAASSSGPASTSSSAPETLTLFSSGESSLTTASTRAPESDSKASTAPCSATNRPKERTALSSNHQTLSERLTPLLISAGLVRGTTHTSIRKQSGAAIRASALWPLDGNAADARKADCSSSNESSAGSRDPDPKEN